MGVTVTGLADFLAQLQEAQDRAVEETKKVVGRGSLNVKRDAQRIIRAASHRGYLPHYPRSISYDVTARGTVVTGTIGPKTEKLQGGLGRILEYGTVNNAPIPHLGPALDKEEPVLARYMEDLGQALLEGWPTPGGPVTDPGGG